MSKTIVDWNSLYSVVEKQFSFSVVESTSMNAFKLLLDNYLLYFRFIFCRMHLLGTHAGFGFYEAIIIYN